LTQKTLSQAPSRFTSDRTTNAKARMLSQISAGVRSIKRIKGPYNQKR